MNPINDAIQRIGQCSEKEQVKAIVDDLDRRFLDNEISVDSNGWVALSKAVGNWMRDHG